MPNFPPPLPPGWSEHNGEFDPIRFDWEFVVDDHIAPDGVTKYYYNSNTKESTYTRPAYPGPFPAFPGGFAIPQPSPPANTTAAPKKQKEKPKVKVAIPGTTWQRITTNEGNVFFFEKESKRSEWSVPDEIKEEVDALETEEKEKREAAEREEKEKEERDRLERLKEKQRVRLELEEDRARKRKALEETGGGREKKAKTEHDGETGGKGDEEYGPADDDDEEAWMRAVAAEFAEADQKAKEDEEDEREKVQETAEEAAKKVFAVPDKVNVSLEEGRALFKVSFERRYQV